MIPIGTKLDQITQEQLRHRLHYDPATGVFTWLVSNKRYTGTIAGYNHCGKDKMYRKIRLHGRAYFAHRLAFLYMKGYPPTNEIDHINGNGLDNSFCNLREATRIENMRNSRLHSHNTSGVCGVSFSNTHKKWRARLAGNEGYQIQIGYFESKEEAIIARKAKEKELGYHENHGKITIP